jgi:cadherin 5 type 2 (VE-cadherin)
MFIYLNIQGESSRIIRHFHFNTWPDFGVPDPPTTLIRFVRDRVSTDAHKPIVVHCSAGVGRSGTFIALDRLIQQMQVLNIDFKIFDECKSLNM